MPRPMTPANRVQLAALTVGMAARLGQIDQDRIEALARINADLLAPDDPVFAGVREFLGEWSEVRRDPEQRMAWGLRLCNAVHLWSRPDPVDAHRVDIHG